MRIGMRCLASLVVFTVTSVVARAAGDDYLVFEGKGAIATLTSTAVGNTAVAAADNPSTSAVGTITAVTKGKHIGELCFHGTFNGTADPDPDGIGWGLVKKAPKTNSVLDRVTMASTNIQDGLKALLEMDKECNTADKSITAMDSAVAQVKTMKLQLGLSVQNQATIAKANKEADELIAAIEELKADVQKVKDDKPATFDELVKKLAPLAKKGKKVTKGMKELVSALNKIKFL